jgi:DNA polymerase III subunit gamma/tau
MSYLVLARKWRPGTFAETVGQEHVLKALSNALASERLHHAYLFAGTRGVGKTTIARILAKALNCDNGITPEPCGKCSACREIDEGRFVDLIEVDAASRTKVDDTRELLDNVQYAPARGRFKVYLIDEVHMLSKSSFNALLKTLEEPPPHVKFLLATTDPQKLPVTVLSRCLQFNLKRLTAAQIRQQLQKICTAETVSFEADALAMIARAADGSMRDSLSLLDQAIAYCGGEVVAEGVGTMLGTIDRQHISHLVSRLASGDSTGLIATIAAVDVLFPDYAQLLDDLARMLQRIAVFQAVGKVDQEDDFDEREIEAFAADLTREDVQLFYQIVLMGRRDLHLAPDPRSGVEMTLLRMLAFQPDGQSGHSGNGAVRPAANKAPPASSRKKPAAATPAVGTHAWQEPDWAGLISRLGLSGLNRQLASNCAYLRREGNTVFLSLDKRSESYLTKPRLAALADALCKFFGEKMKVDIVIGEVTAETPVQIEARQETADLEAARAGLEADPNIKALKEMFGAELVAESVEPINSKPGVSE